MLPALLTPLYSRLLSTLYKMNPTCLFCKIVSGESPAEIVYRDDFVTAFRDLHPVAPTHILIIPNKHIQSLSHVEEGDELVLGHLLFVAKKIAKMEGILEEGYRTIVNTGPHGGQTVFHLHLHVIGGRHMHYPIG